jgi:hypothetical protein
MMLIATIAIGQVSERIHLKDSSNEASLDANRALRSYGFVPTEVSKNHKKVLLENEIHGTTYQVEIKNLGTKGIKVTTYAFHNERSAWSNFETIISTFTGIEKMIRYRVENNEFIPHICLSDTPFWAMKIKSETE